YSPDELNLDLQTGDLLFCSPTSSALSKAIDQATQTGNETHFDHIGIVDIKNDTVYVLHAAPKKGVCRESLAQFFFSYKEKVTISIYRLNDKYAKAIPAAIKKGYTLLRQPYNYSYIIKDKGLYCSEYIYEIFAADSIFTLNPMTFKDPQTGQFLAGWVDHYKKLGIPIPEGEPGCNPNGMAASDKIELTGEVIIDNKALKTKK
ncbi:MAG TPA: YiiX/YebB-like N1pC/P60 family cysteine hydrolase, partial [Prolixibacteraceae bacterium]